VEAARGLDSHNGQADMEAEEQEGEELEAPGAVAMEGVVQEEAEAADEERPTGKADCLTP
jgi:hypothetical protein